MVIAVGCNRQVTQARRVGLPGQAQAPLPSFLGLQVDVAQAAIIQVVERGHTKRMLVKGPYINRCRGQQTIAQGHRGGQAPLVGRTVALANPFRRIGVDGVGLQLHPTPLGLHGHGGDGGPARRARHIILGVDVDIIVQTVVRQVLRHSKLKSLGRQPSQRGRGIALVLAVAVGLNAIGIL